MSCLGAIAQKGNDAVSITGEDAVPVFRHERGVGLFIKGLYGTGNAAQLTLSIGISSFKADM